MEACSWQSANTDMDVVDSSCSLCWMPTQAAPGTPPTPPPPAAATAIAATIYVAGPNVWYAVQSSSQGVLCDSSGLACAGIAIGALLGRQATKPWSLVERHGQTLPYRLSGSTAAPPEPFLPSNAAHNAADAVAGAETLWIISRTVALFPLCCFPSGRAG